MNCSHEGDMTTLTSITSARAILVYRDKALERTVIDIYCLNKHSKMLYKLYPGLWHEI